MSQTLSAVPHKSIGVAVIWNDDGHILIDKRLPQGVMGGLWEFPGGKIEPGETVQDCIRREISEEIGIAIAVQDHLITVEHSYNDFRITLEAYNCTHLYGVPQTLECQEIRWVTLAEIDQFSFPQANQKIIAALRQLHC
ncbi:MAG: 8-oxo-dGTP diphosphatase MutT [Arthrospira sp. SH-MAG29]|nr:8-oxo-dGTP diphosphatase MutT [Arthrospira sp. SH-MAG29]MBS0016961.1 8-oxo-dGTP diphosphatase MutT [Arthrospira sp. SH-MAG29]